MTLLYMYIHQFERKSKEEAGRLMRIFFARNPKHHGFILIGKGEKHDKSDQLIFLRISETLIFWKKKSYSGRQI